MNDNQARDQIVRNVDTNYFVEAGAGSGKTTILVERMVSMVEKGFPVEKICTITFTKAAANEFYARFQKRLSERSRDEHKDSYHAGQLIEQTELTKERCARALQNIDSCFMGTIDSFCNMILSEHPLEAGIPANSKVVEEEDIIDRYLQEYTKIAVSNDYASLRDKYRLFVNTQNNPTAVFKMILSEIISIRDAEFVYDKPDFVSIEEKYKRDKKDLVVLFNKLVENKDLAYVKRSGARDSAWDILEQRLNVLTDSDWDRNFTFVLDTLKKLKPSSGDKLRLKPVDDIEVYFGASIARLTAHTTGKNRTSWYELADEGFANIVEEMKDYQSRVALDFTVECMNKMAEVLRKQGSLTFFDYKLYLRDMLKKDAAGNHKLIEHIYNRHSYFLIDEFQDTDPMQAEIFFYLSAVDFDSDWKKCLPKPGSLFIVGDPKQSIYRFKNADVASFKNVRSLFTGTSGEVLKLTSNFRSTFTLHNWFNNVFGEHLLSEDTDDQSRYEPITNKDKDDEYDTGIYKYVPLSVEDDSKEILDIVNTLVNNPEITINENTTIQYKDIMIITDNKKLLARYVNAFTANRIPFKVEGDIDFNECPALKELIAVYKAAVYPDNNFHLYEALNTRLFNISSDVLMAVKDSLKAVRRTGMFTSENEKINKVMEIIYRYHDISKRASASALFSELIDDLRLFAICGNHNQEYVYYVLELLREKEASGEIVSCEDAVDYLTDLISNEIKLERCVSLEKNNNRVHLANLHKVKGLEAPVVILAGSKKRNTINRPSKRVEYIGDNPRCYVLEIRKDNTYLSFKDSHNKKEAEKASSEAERIRQLYVAATRAKRMLIIADANPWKDLSQFVTDDFFNKYSIREPEPFVPEVINGDELYDNVESIISDKSESKQASLTIHKPSDIHFEEIREDYIPLNTKRNPMLIGTLVHRLMEVIVSSGNRIDTDKFIDDLCSNIDINDHYYSDILHKVNETIQNGGYKQENGFHPDILNELLTADELYCEVPFSYQNGINNITTGIIDVVYRKNDQWIIVDYKTNTDGKSLEAEYETQLDDYIKAVKINYGIDAQALIYHIKILQN